MEIIIILGLIMLNGLFAMSEISLISSRKFKLENARKKGSSGAKTAMDLAENPTRFLSTVQIGITLIGILLGVYSGENFTSIISGALVKIPFLAHYAPQIAPALVVLIITYLSIVLGELFPKRVGMTFPEPIAIFMAKPMLLLSKITSPFVWLLTVTNDLLLAIFGIKRPSDNKVSEDEIKAIIRESADGGEIQDIEQDIVERVFELGDRKANTLFTHRSDIVYLGTQDSFQTVKSKVKEEKHSAYPLCEDDDIDNVIGIVLLKDLFGAEENGFDINKYMKKALFIKKDTYAYKVLELFKEHQTHYAIAIDEFGTTQGIITMDDVVDALIGDVTQQDQDEYQIMEREDGTWLVDGQYSAIEFLKRFEIEMEDDFSDRFTTVAGLIIDVNSSLPKVGEKIILQDYVLEVLDKDGQRIDKVWVRKVEN